MTSIHHTHGLLLAMMFEVGFGGFSSMMGNIQMVGVREVGIVLRCLFFAILRGLLVMFGCFPMMVYWLF